MAKAVKTTERRRRHTVAELLPLSQATNALELVQEARAAMAAEPKRVNLNFYIAGRPQDGCTLPVTRHRAPSGQPACGTVGCFAGWIAILAGYRVDGEALEAVQQLLGPGIEYTDEFVKDGWQLSQFFDAGEKLFAQEYPDKRPEPGSAEYLKVVLDRVDRFIAVNKKALKAQPLALRLTPVRKGKD